MYLYCLVKTGTTRNCSPFTIYPELMNKTCIANPQLRHDVYIIGVEAHWLEEKIFICGKVRPLNSSQYI